MTPFGSTIILYARSLLEYRRKKNELYTLGRYLVVRAVVNTAGRL